MAAGMLTIEYSSQKEKKKNNGRLGKKCVAFSRVIRSLYGAFLQSSMSLLIDQDQSHSQNQLREGCEIWSFSRVCSIANFFNGVLLLRKKKRKDIG